MNVTVYTKPNCVQCDATKRTLKNIGVEFDSIDVTENEDAFNMLVEKGFKAMPVVNVDDEWWSGFNPDKINGLVD